ncbi:MAG: hypothetical protein AB7H88_04145 [Vicinamibacterales bacterium]
MKLLLLLAGLLAAFEVAWRLSPALRPHRAQLRLLLAVFWSVVFATYFGARWGLVPEAFRIGDHGVLRFAVDSLIYQGQAAELAAAVAAHGISALFQGDYFAYARLMAVLYTVSYADPLTGMVFNAVFYITSVSCVFVLTESLLGERAAVAATWLGGLWPGFLFHEMQTLRWAATTAGIHLALMGMGRVLGPRPSTSSVAAVLLGFLLVVFDLPWTAQVMAGWMFVWAVVLFVPAVWTPGLRRRAVLVALLALTMIPLYRSLWPATVPPLVTEYLAAGSPAYDGTVFESGPATSAGEEPGAWQRATAVLVDQVRGRFEAQVIRIVDMRDRAIADALAATEQRGQYANAGHGAATALVDARNSVRTAGDLVRNLPLAFATVFLEPAPAALLGGSTGMSNIRPYVFPEMAVYYLLLPFTAIGIAVRLASRGQGVGPTLFLVAFVLAVYAILGTIVMNAGTLYRLRLPYVLIQFGFAVAGLQWAAWRLGWMRPPAIATAGDVP